MDSLYNRYDLTVENAYIIRIQGNEISESLAERCSQSCQQVGRSYRFWDAYDGVDGAIKSPPHHNAFMSMIKVIDHYMTKGEVATALSHISLWAHCVIIDRPIIILEHDAVMIKNYSHHQIYNSIAWLGAIEQYRENHPISLTPPHGSDGPNCHFICRAHAYAIDPTVAKNLCAHALRYGIDCPLDWMIRADLFPMHQTDLFAVDIQGPQTTILNRPRHGRTTVRNDRLEI